MYDMTNIAGMIKQTAKQKKIKIGDMLNNLELGINTISQSAKGQVLSSITLAKIADYLDVSVDYLLGRTDNPEVNK